MAQARARAHARAHAAADDRAHAGAAAEASPVYVVNADHERRMQALRSWQRLLDSAFRVPGTNFRFGWDPIIGLIPWAGDLATALLSCAVIVQAHQMRVPRVVQLRMLLNIAIDVVIGIVPFVGDVADVFWKSNTKNLALLERHAGRSVPASPADWLFVGLVLAGVIAVAVVPLIVVYWLLHGVLGRGLF